MSGIESLINTPNWRLAVAAYKFDGIAPLDKFGENPDIDVGTPPESVWDFGGPYIWSTTANITTLSSSDNNDTQIISVLGLDAFGYEVSQEVTLTGQTPAPLATPLWRVYRMQNEGLDGEDIAGIVYCYVGTAQTNGVPTNDSDVRAIINDGHNQTLMCIYTVPRGKVAFLYRGEFGISRAQTTGAGEGLYRSRRFGKVFKVKKRVDITNQGTSIYQDDRSFPDVIPALTDIELRVQAVSANNCGFFGTFDLLIIDQSQFSPGFLASIGQPST